MLVMTPVNRLYLTGLESSNGLLLLRPGQDAAFYTDFRYLEMARRAVGFLPVRRLEQNTRLRAQYTALAGAGHWRRVGYEGTVTAAALSQMKKHMPAVEEWIDCAADIGTLRSVKSRREQAVIRRAVAANDAVFAAAL